MINTDEAFKVCSLLPLPSRSRLLLPDVCLIIMMDDDDESFFSPVTSTQPHGQGAASNLVPHACMHA